MTIPYQYADHVRYTDKVTERFVVRREYDLLSWEMQRSCLAEAWATVELGEAPAFLKGGELLIFTETKLKGAFIIDLERREDARGFFARSFCQKEFEEHGLKAVIAQENIAHNGLKGTLRGMHFQYPPATETKIVRCTRGAILDIIVDLRPESPTFLQHVGVELSEGNQRALYVPERFAHGYQSLCDDTDTSYGMSEFYAPDCEGGLKYDDPALSLPWPLAITTMSDKDRKLPLFENCAAEIKLRMSVGAVAPLPQH